MEQIRENDFSFIGQIGCPILPDPFKKYENIFHRIHENLRLPLILSIDHLNITLKTSLKKDIDDFRSNV